VVGEALNIKQKGITHIMRCGDHPMRTYTLLEEIKLEGRKKRQGDQMVEPTRREKEQQL